jgi:hypothetical protein
VIRCIALFLGLRIAAPPAVAVNPDEMLADGSWRGARARFRRTYAAWCTLRRLMIPMPHSPEI